jgi:hypothetical protein
MQQQVQRYFIGAVAFGAVVVASTAGILVALAAATACIGAVYAAGRVERQPSRRVPRTARISARPLADEEKGHPLVPDDPSLILTTYP